MIGRIATIDLGTNTVRILVAEAGEKGFEPMFSDQAITRLGEGLHQTGRLGPEAMKRTVSAVARMINNAEKFRPFDLRVYATSAARDAGNTKTLAAMLYKATGANLTVISWKEEARLSLEGARLVVGREAAEFILFDIGGGSTEYIHSFADGGMKGHGTDLGVVRLSETYITKHPVSNAEYQQMLGEIEEKVDIAFNEIEATGEETIVGTAGTVTSLAAMALGLTEYSRMKVNNYRLTADKIETLRIKLFAMTIEERSRISSLSHGREDLIVPGIAIIQATLKRACATLLTVSDFGMREGMIVDMLHGGG
ncbi:Exopolyphosphatase [hydrothermal vent metagenome]|uniref:Exopolyphosphatase n=1 Tax=hydrothermal vent metagenome TaxID=652676 RepID=A0A3B1BLR4_9ZZZZ